MCSTSRSSCYWFALWMALQSQWWRIHPQAKFSDSHFPNELQFGHSDHLWTMSGSFLISCLAEAEVAVHSLYNHSYHRQRQKPQRKLLSKLCKSSYYHRELQPLKRANVWPCKFWMSEAGMPTRSTMSDGHIHGKVSLIAASRCANCSSTSTPSS